MDDSKYISTREATKQLSISAVTLRRWAMSGNIEYIRTPTGQRRYRIDSIKNESPIHDAIEALKKEADALREENATLREQKEQMDRRIAQLEAKIAEMKTAKKAQVQPQPPPPTEPTSQPKPTKSAKK